MLESNHHKNSAIAEPARSKKGNWQFRGVMNRKQNHPEMNLRFRSRYPCRLLRQLSKYQIRLATMRLRDPRFSRSRKPVELKQSLTEIRHRIRPNIESLVPITPVFVTERYSIDLMLDRCLRLDESIDRGSR